MVDVSIWCEKYRPKKVSQVVGDFREKILAYLKDPKSIPHFLLASKSAGTGKTSLAKAIINELECDYININSSDERNIDTIREKIKAFCSTQSSKPGMRRCIFLDEADGLTRISQEALRNVMETYAGNAFFILTCNNINKVVEPIQSRCQIINFSYPKKEEIVEYLQYICTEEKMQFDKEGLLKLVDINYPSIRNCVISLQDLFVQKLAVNINTVQPANYIFNVYWDKLKQGDWKSIKQSLMESSVDARDLNEFFWQKALQEENIKIIQLTCRNEKDVALGANPVIVICSSLIEMVK